MNGKNLYKPLYISILIIFLILQISSLYMQSDVWWDSSVYIGMGKYMHSSGKSGLWEPSRPLVWPLIIGFFWKIGVDYIFFSKFMAILFGVGSVILTYHIVSKLFNERVAFYAVLFLCLSKTYFVYNSIPQSEIPSMFFFLLGFYLFIQKKRKLSGFILGVASMTRFFQIFLVIPIMLSYFYLVLVRRERTKDFVLFLLCFFAPVVPYLIFNTYLYNNMFYPFALQAFMTKNTGWVFNQPISFYIINLLKENLLVVFSLLGITTLLRTRNFQKNMFLFILLFAFILYNLTRHKEMRLLVSLLPFIYTTTSLGLISFLEKFKAYKSELIFVMTTIFLIQAFNQLEFNKYEDNLNTFHLYINSTNVKDKIWITNPSFIVFTDKKAEQLIYYPLYNSTKAKYLQNEVSNANLVMVNTCDILPCPPSDRECLKETEKLITVFNNNLILMHNSTYNKCNYFIFQK